MKLEVGKRYRTRDCNIIVRITGTRNSGGYQFTAKAEVDPDRIFGEAEQTFTSDGRYNTGCESGLDLAEEVADEQAAPRSPAPATVDRSMTVVAPASKESVAEARSAINDILGASVDQAVKSEALRTLVALCRVENVSISGSTFSTGG